MLDDKIFWAKELIIEQMGVNPIIGMSFGKDSMVMLHLINSMGLNLPVVYWKRERGFQEKQKFANRVIEKFNLTVHDAPPLATRFMKKNGKMEVVNYFSISHDCQKSIAIPSGILDMEDDFLCSLYEMYGKPLGLCRFPWDALFIGHKDTDVDPCQGSVPLTCDYYQVDEGTRFVFPLRHFTDDDIWEYSRKFGVMQDRDRYPASGENMKFNNDYFPACTACVNPSMPDSVWCPKQSREVKNVSSQVLWVDSIRPSYWK